MLKPAFAALLVAVATVNVAPASTEQDWPFYGGDQGGTKFSPLADVTTSTAGRLGVAWQWAPREKALDEFGTRPGNFQATPLMIDNVLYLSTPYNRVVALNAETGAELWAFDPKAYVDGQPPNGTGFVHRGIAAWRDAASGNKLRIFINSRYRLISHYTNTSPPVIYKNLVILGNGVGDRLVYRNDPPGDIRAFDAHTGKQMWTFHTIPQPGETGNDTWQQDSWSYTGHTNAWPPMTLDAERGLVYVPLGTPSNDFFGGRRPGANLFAETIVCLDANTGVRKWHYQLVHHGLWDYDNPSPPNLVSIRVDGKAIDAVVQLTKQGYAFVFDRVTGKPVWPVEERPVPASDVEGEHAWATQPVPAKPPAFSEQGVSLDDAFDLTPELKAAAQKELQKYRTGPLFTPPSNRGTVQRGQDRPLEREPTRLRSGRRFHARRRHERGVHGRDPAAQAAVWLSGGAGFEPRRHQVARAVRRHPLAAPSPGSQGCDPAGVARRRGRPRRARHRRRGTLRRRRGSRISCGGYGHWR